MSDRRYAVIDIGSNAARLLIGVIDDNGRFVMEVFSRLPLALGAGAFRRRRIGREQRRRLEKTVAGMALFIEAMRPAAWRAVATAAVRDAANRDEVLAGVRARSGVRLRVLSGEEEAAIIGRFVAAQFPRARYVLNMDVGGGSTDCALLEGGEVAAAETFAVGTAREDIGAAAEKARFAGWFRAQRRAGMTLAGSGGGMRALVSLCGEVSPAGLALWRRKLAAMTPLAAAARYSLTPDRAANLPRAIRIYQLALRSSGGGVIRPIEGGLAEAILRRLADGGD